MQLNKNLKNSKKIAKNSQKNEKNTQKIENSKKNTQKLEKNKNKLPNNSKNKLNKNNDKKEINKKDVKISKIDENFNKNKIEEINKNNKNLKNKKANKNIKKNNIFEENNEKNNNFQEKNEKLNENYEDINENNDSGKRKFFRRVNTIFSPRKLALLFVIIVAVITVPKIDTPSMSQTDAIVTMLCIDKQQENVVIAATVLTPGQDNVPNYQVFSGKGTTLGGAIDDVSITMGKEMGFAQCEVMAVGQNLSDFGVMQTLDYMTRTKKVGRNTHLISFEGDIADFSQAMSDLSKEKSLKLENILNFDRRYIVSQDSNIESFYIGYFSDISLGIMPKVAIKNEEQDNSIEIKGGDSTSSSGTGGGSGSGSGTSGASSGGQNQSKYFVNDGSVVVFKKGKKFLDVPSSEVKKINYFVNNSQQGTITIKNVTDKFFDNSTILLDIVKKKNDINVSFNGETPVYKSQMELIVYVEQVLENQPEKMMLKRNNEFLTDEVVEKIKEQVESEMQSCIDFCKTNKADMLEVYQYFYKLQNKKFKKYLKKVGKENYLDGIKFEFNIKVSNEY